MVNSAANPVTASSAGRQCAAHGAGSGSRAGSTGTAGTSAFAVQARRHRSSARIDISVRPGFASTLRRKRHARFFAAPGQKTEHLRVITDWRAPADDNCAERDISMTLFA
ncbi:hypothetical protein ACSNOI_26530 [Actinomadura kijaniata]|uniref:hypothetical protein n=1 Tax=Actinomadura kijaniata TaxID=46161 RepID=UPI003F1BA142